MLDTNHQNSSCTFAEQLVSYLYSEANEREKRGFEAHLASCETCADELSAFGFVSSSVQQWRTEEFLPIQTPAMAIPFEKSSEISVNSTEKRSWLDNLRQYITLSPAQTAIAAFTVLVICVGLVLFAYNFSGKTEVAEKNEDKPRKSVASPMVEQPAKNGSEEIARENSASDQNNAPEVINAIPKIENSSRSDRKTSIEKVSNSAKQTAKNVVVAQNSNNSATVRKVKDINNINKAATAKNQKLPKLADFDDVEDNSLRLSDLMAEVENK